MNKIKGYRNMMCETQKDWANLLGISRVSYSMKESGTIPFSDKEKVIIKNHVNSVLLKHEEHLVTIDDLFF